MAALRCSAQRTRMSPWVWHHVGEAPRACRPTSCAQLLPWAPLSVLLSPLPDGTPSLSPELQRRPAEWRSPFVPTGQFRKGECDEDEDIRPGHHSAIRSGRGFRDVRSLHDRNRRSRQDPRRQGRGFWPDLRCIGRDTIGGTPVRPASPDRHHEPRDSGQGNVARRRAASNRGPADRGAARNNRSGRGA
jgi:hypothetical protein